MSIALKQRLLYAALLLFTLWPFVHMVLVARFDISAWKLAGWGMYSTPQPSFSRIEVLGRKPGSAEFEPVTGLPEGPRAQAAQFLERRRWLGQLVRPKKLARSLMKHYPQFAALRIIVDVPTLDRGTGMILMQQISYDYPESERRR